MEIDLKNPTADQIVALKENAPALAEQLGLIDPGKALTPEQAAVVSFSHKINSVDVTKSVVDWSNDASKGEGADARFREATDLAKKAEPAIANAEAQERFRTAIAAKQMPTDQDIQVMADSFGVDKADLMASIEGEPEEGPPKKKDDAGPFVIPNGSITLDMLPADLRDDIMYLREQKGTAAQSELDKLIQKSIDNDKTVVTLMEKHGGTDEEKVAFKQSLFEISKLRTERRIQQMSAGASAADLTRSIEESVGQTAVNQEKAGIPGKAAPQPIIMAPSEPGGQEVRLLSDDKIKTDLPIDHPDFAKNQALVAIQNRGNEIAKRETAPTL